MDDTVDPGRLARTMLPVLCGILGVDTLEASVIDSPLFSPTGYQLGEQPVESLHIVEFMVVLEKQFGLRMLDPDALRKDATLRGLAERIVRTADGLAVQRFCEASGAPPGPVVGT